MYVAENRAALSDANIVKHIMIFLAEQKYQELHVFAVMLLANCVEDADILKVIGFFYFVFCKFTDRSNRYYKSNQNLCFCCSLYIRYAQLLLGTQPFSFKACESSFILFYFT